MRKEKETCGSINKRLHQRGGPVLGEMKEHKHNFNKKEQQKLSASRAGPWEVRGPLALAAVLLSVVRAKAPVCWLCFPLCVSLRVSGGQTPQGAGTGRFSQHRPCVRTRPTCH